MQFTYPLVKRDTIQDNYFGKTITDPYRFLENVDSQDTVKFVDDENVLSSKYIESCQSRDEIKKRLKELFEYPRYSCPYKKGDNYFMSINSGLQNQYVVYIMRGGLDAKQEVFFDPNELSEDGIISLSSYTVRFSEDGKWWAYGLQKSGSDWVSIKIKNVETGVDLPEELLNVKFSQISWTKDNKGFFYSYYPDLKEKCDGKETNECTFQKLYYHRLNTPQSEDILIFEDPEHPNYRFIPHVSHCGQYLHIFINQSCEYHLWYFHKFDDPLNPKLNEKLKFEKIITEFADNYYYITNEGPLHYIHTTRNALNFKIVAVDLTDSNTWQESNWKDVIEEHKTDVLDSALVVRNNILVCHYISDVISRIELRNLTDGAFLKQVKLPVGTVSTIHGRKEDKEFFYSFTSFVYPYSIFHMKLDQPDSLKNEPYCFRESKPKNFEPSDYVTKQIFYNSKDGTRVPLFIVHKKDFVQDGNQPALLYAYGGFNVSLQPYFSLNRIILMDNLKGVFALANIRGGGEYGEKWHKSGQLLMKQNCFDDFIAAGEYLIKENYTSPEKLIIQGGSNGGLLVGAVSNQRPDLFGCTICQVGVLDMLRFQKFTIGHAWISEYGSSDEEEHFNNLIRYSPLHTIPESVSRYPATLLLTADHDDRVVPLHSFKFIAELQHKLGKKLPDTPLMIRIDTKAGHGAGKPVEKIIEESADIYCFIINSLGLTYFN